MFVRFLNKYFLFISIFYCSISQLYCIDQSTHIGKQDAVISSSNSPAAITDLVQSNHYTTNLVPEKEHSKYIHIENINLYPSDNAEILIQTHIAKVEGVLVSGVKTKPITFVDTDQKGVKKCSISGTMMPDGRCMVQVFLFNTNEKSVLEISKTIYFIGDFHGELQKQKISLEKTYKTRSEQLSVLPSLHIKNVYLYNAGLLLSKAALLKSQRLTYFQLEQYQLNLSSIQALLNAADVHNRNIPLTSCRLQYVSEVDQLQHSFEIRIPEKAAKPAKGIMSRKNLPGLVYLFADDDVSIVRPRDDQFIWVRFSPARREFVRTFRLKELFDEFQSIIEGSFNTEKKRVYLISPLNTMEALFFYSHNPSKYAAVSLFTSEDTYNEEKVKKIIEIFPSLKPNLQLLISDSITNNGLKAFDLLKTVVNENKVTQQKLSFSRFDYALIQSEAWKYFQGHKLGLTPSSLLLETDDLERYSRLYYLSIQQTVIDGLHCSIAFHKKPGQVIDLQIENIEAFSIDLTYPVFNRNARMEIYINGSIAFNEDLKDASTLTFKSSGARYILK